MRNLNIRGEVKIPALFILILILIFGVLLQTGCQQQGEPPSKVLIPVSDDKVKFIEAGSKFKEAETILANTAEVLEDKKKQSLAPAEKKDVDAQLKDVQAKLLNVKTAQAKIADFVFTPPAAATAAATANCTVIDILENIYECKSGENAQMAFEYPNPNVHVTFNINGGTSAVASGDLIKVPVNINSSAVMVTYHFDNTGKRWSYKILDGAGTKIDGFFVNEPSDRTTVISIPYTFLMKKEQ